MLHSGVPICRTSKGNANWLENSERSRNRVFNYSVRLSRGKRLLVRVVGRFEKMRVREIGIPLTYYNLWFQPCYNKVNHVKDKWLNVLSMMGLWCLYDDLLVKTRWNYNKLKSYSRHLPHNASFPPVKYSLRLLALSSDPKMAASRPLLWAFCRVWVIANGRYKVHIKNTVYLLTIKLNLIA